MSPRLAPILLGLLLTSIPLTHTQSAEDVQKRHGISRVNLLADGTFEQTEEAVYPWTGVDEWGHLRKAVAHKFVNIHVSKSNQFTYAWLGYSASFVDLDGDGLKDIISPDGNGMFWYWKNIGTAGNPEFGHGEVMNLLVDNNRSRYLGMYSKTDVATIARFEGKASLATIGLEDETQTLTKAQQRIKPKIDEKRKTYADKIYEQMLKANEKIEEGQGKKKPEDIRKMADDEANEKFPYPWEEDASSTLQANTPLPNLNYSRLNGYRQLRAIAAPCDWDNNKTTDFIVGDAQGNLYKCINKGSPTAPNFTTYYRKDFKDCIILKVAPKFDLVTRKTQLEPVEFMNYATPFVIDWNQDGKLDLLVGEGTYSVNSIQIFTNPYTTPNKPETAPALCVGEDRTFLAPFAHDWDGDGHLDLFVNDNKGQFWVYPNIKTTETGEKIPGYFTKKLEEMTEYLPITFEGMPNNNFFAYCTPQPCDWNEDGIMDIIWGEPYGRIMVALGKAIGEPVFQKPFPVMSKEPAKKYPITIVNNITGTPILQGEETGASIRNSARYYSAAGNLINFGGFPLKQIYGLIPGWNPDTWDPETNTIQVKELDRVKTPKPHMSFGTAPVPYDWMEVVKEEVQGAGEGNTLVLKWHDPAQNKVFKQRRDAVTMYGRGWYIRISGNKEVGNQFGKLSDNWKISFYMKLDGEFERILTYMSGDDVDSKGGGQMQSSVYKPPIGKWFRYEFVEAKHPAYLKNPFGRNSDGSLHIRVIGRGEVRIRDAAYSTTKEDVTPPTIK